MHKNPFYRLLIGILVFTAIIICINTVTVKGSSPSTIENENITVPIIMYHSIKPLKPGKGVITPAEFENDLKYLRSYHYTTITMTDLINYVDGKNKLPEKPIILSFDDGYYNDYVYAYPLIKKYQMKMVLSIIGKSTDDFSNVTDVNLNYSHVTWGQINEMTKSGLVEIQNHTYNMHTITRSRVGCQRNKGETLSHYETALTEDINKLQKEIELNTGSSPNTFTYPYGKACKESYPIIKKLGFRASLTCDWGVNVITKNPERLYGLKRIGREHGISLQTALQKAMKNLKLN